MSMWIQMYRFTIRRARKSKTQPSVFIPSFYTFGHKDSHTCQMWVNRINDLLNMDTDRPKNLLVRLVSYPLPVNMSVSWSRSGSADTLQMVTETYFRLKFKFLQTFSFVISRFLLTQRVVKDSDVKFGKQWLQHFLKQK